MRTHSLRASTVLCFRVLFGCTAGKSGAVGFSSLDVDAIGHASSFAAAGDVDLPSTPEYT